MPKTDNKRQSRVAAGVQVTSNRLETTDLVLDALRDVKNVEQLSFLREISAVGLVILDTIQTIETGNIDDDFVALALDSCGLVYIVIDKCKEEWRRNGETFAQFKVDCEDLTGTLQQILQFVKKKVRRKEVSKIIKESSDGRKVLNFRDQLKECIKAFKGSSNSSIREVLQEVIDEKIPSGPWSGVLRRGEVYDRVSFFPGAHDFNIHGGQFYNISGNYTAVMRTEGPNSGRSLPGIIEGPRVVLDEDVSLEREVLKGRGFRLYAARNSGKVVAIKVYEGNHATERCSEAARFYHGKYHPNLLRMIGVSALQSSSPFLVLEGEYEGRADYMLGQVLKQGLKQSLTVGIQTVASLSSGLDYLNDREFPFASVELDRFVLLSNRGRIVISIEPEDVRPSEWDQRLDIHVPRSREALDVFHRLCEKTFDAACKAHYESEQARRTFVDEFVETSGTQFPDAPGFREVDGQMPLEPLSERSPRLQTGAGRRWELVWKPTKESAIPLHEISSQFQFALLATSSFSDLGLNHRRGRYTARTSHRCPGYNRVEITLTADIAKSAIVSHASPTPFEICLVCKEVVRAGEVFNCICGQEDDESVPTVRCSHCFGWHHRDCIDPADSELVNFICTECCDSSSTFVNVEIEHPSTPTPVLMSAQNLPPIRPTLELQAAQRKHAVLKKYSREVTSSGSKVQFCNFCRARKIRCDGAHPACSCCVRRQLDCQYMDDSSVPGGLAHRQTTGSGPKDLPCNFCRVRKTKCDGAYPACSSCARKQLDCHYVPHSSSPSYRLEGMETSTSYYPGFPMADAQLSPISHLLRVLGITREDLNKRSDQMRQFTRP